MSLSVGMFFFFICFSGGMFLLFTLISECFIGGFNVETFYYFCFVLLFALV